MEGVTDHFNAQSKSDVVFVSKSSKSVGTPTKGGCADDDSSVHNFCPLVCFILQVQQKKRKEHHKHHKTTPTDPPKPSPSSMVHSPWFPPWIEQQLKVILFEDNLLFFASDKTDVREQVRDENQTGDLFAREDAVWLHELAFHPVAADPAIVVFEGW
eukprot:TRINITY_DN22135_c0_g1_i1.p3 TRINITY_DN22135_c0_g1~~TRINITY_DN22135_c0_g1_i1.p3  ORF type:complete len:157 (+),score=31.36 TRINITY_DN22135_c0_g1_i1:556-1026(+)